MLSTNPLRPIIMNNACPSRITATAGTSISRDYNFKKCHYLFFKTEIYNPHLEISRLHSISIAGSNFRSLSNIPHCWPKFQPGPYFSSSVVDHPLRPTKDQRLGYAVNSTNNLILHRFIF